MTSNETKTAIAGERLDDKTRVTLLRCAAEGGVRTVGDASTTLFMLADAAWEIKGCEVIGSAIRTVAVALADASECLHDAYLTTAPDAE